MAEKAADLDEASEIDKETVRLNSDILSWTGPRTVVVSQTDSGFGFTLRHFIVYPPESAVQAFKGSELDEDNSDGHKCKKTKLSALEPMDTIFVKQVKDGGSAHHAGLKIGDRIMSVNGETVAGKTYSQVIALIQASESQLTLRVVPKDEDILQMAYQSSAYNQCPDAPQGSPREVTNPLSTYSSLAHIQPSLHTALQNTDAAVLSKSSLSPRYKAELQVSNLADGGDVLVRNEPRSRSSLDSASALHMELNPLRMHSSTGNLPVAGLSHEPRSISGTYDPSMAGMASGVAGTERLTVTADSSSHNPEHKSQGERTTSSPLRTSRRVIRLSHPNKVDRAQSMESMDRSSDSSHSTKRRQEDADSRMTSGLKSKDSMDIPSANILDVVHDTAESDRLLSDDNLSGGSATFYKSSYQQHTDNTSHTAQPYTRSHTTTALIKPTYIQEQDRLVASQELPGSPAGTIILPPSRLLTHSPHSNQDPEGSAVISVVSRPHDDREGADHMQTSLHRQGRVFSSDFDFSLPPSSQGQGVYISHINGCEIPLEYPDSSSVTVGSSPGYKKPSPATNITITTGKRDVRRHSGASLVSERVHQLEGAEQENSDLKTNYASGSREGTPGDSKRTISMLKYSDSVASRAAFFEQKRSSPNRQDSSATPKRNISIEINPRSKSAEPYREETYHLKAGGPTSISIYFRNPEPTHAKMPPSQEILFGSPLHDRRSSDSSDSQSSSSRGQVQVPVDQDLHDQSPVALIQDQYGSEEAAESPRQPVVTRQPSCLTTSHSPSNKTPPEDPFVLSQGTGNAEADMDSSPSTGPQTVTTGSLSKGHYNIKMPVMVEEDEEDLFPSNAMPEESSKSPPSQHPVPKLDGGDSKLVAVDQTPEQTSQDEQKPRLPPVSPLSTQQQLDPPNQDEDHPTTPTNIGSMKKIKAFFGELQRFYETPRIIEAFHDKNEPNDTSSPTAEVSKEGWLNSKITVSDGKRASDRSWKLVWAVLRGHTLYLYKEKVTAMYPPNFPEEYPISIKSSRVEVAHDYTKKKNVFRLITDTGSEYLFQSEDQGAESMIAWIKALQAVTGVDDDKGIGSPDLIVKKTVENEQAVHVKVSPVILSPKSKELKDVKKSVTRALRARSPGPSYSPVVKQRKHDKDSVESPKSKETKTWKGRMVKKFKLYGSSSPPSIDQEAEVTVTGTFGIPLEMCVMSPNFEFVPLIVEVCSTVVEERGLEVVGIYRVPGNTAAVNSLQEEVNKEPETINLEENERWQDVNVVGSLLKSYFRKLPEPMVLEDLYDSFITANRQENPEKRMLLIKKLLHDLPDHHFETFHFLATHLNKVAINGELNKMDARNLAIVFGPTLIRKADDSMVTMVRDMSDQCRIVESIILHPEWFFSSWDVDTCVPVDEEVMDAMPVSGMNQMLLSRAENLESPKGKEIKHKELVSSIIQAASRKAKKRDKKMVIDSMPSVEAEGPSEGYNERNIDEEVAARKGKLPAVQSQTLITMTTKQNQNIALKETKKSVSTSALQTLAESQNTDSVRDRIYSAKMAFLGGNESDNLLATRTATSSLSLNEPEPEVKIKYYTKKLPVYPCGPMPYTENTKPRMLRRYSEDTLRDRPETERPQLQELNRSWGVGSMSLERHTLTPTAQVYQNQLQKETSLMRQTELTRQKEIEERALAKQLIEQEMLKTQRELEMDESVEDLLAKPTEITLPMSEHSAADTPSFISQYSGLSNYPYNGKASAGSVQPSSDYSSSMSPVSVQKYDSSSSAGHYPDNCDGVPQEKRSSRFLQMVNVHPQKPLSHSSHDDLDVYSVRSINHRTPPCFDPHGVIRKETASRKILDDQSKSGKGPTSDSPSDFRQVGMMGQRKGSLDSLLDYYEHNDQLSASSSTSGDSELLSSLNSTFDEKLKIFLGPKEDYYESSAQPTKVSQESKTLSAGAGSEVSSSNQGVAHKNLSDTGNSQTKDAVFLEGSYRDPSLHRLHSVKSDTKIGIASRFERKKPTEEVKTEDSSLCSSLLSEDSSMCLSESESRTVASSSECISSVKKPNMTEQKISMSKDEKTDTNLSKQGENQKSPERATGRNDSRCSSEERQVSESARPNKSRLNRRVKMKDVVNMKIRRRHTVGGTNDLEHFKALCHVNQINKSEKSEQKLSAFDRLQPAGSEAPFENRGLPSRMQSEHLRTSSPDILSLARSQSQSLLEHVVTEEEKNATRSGQEGDITDSLEN